MAKTKHKCIVHLAEGEVEKIHAGLKRHGEVHISRVGKIKKTAMKKRKGFNPTTKKLEVFDKTYRASFKPSEETKRIINNVKSNAKNKGAKGKGKA